MPPDEQDVQPGSSPGEDTATPSPETAPPAVSDEGVTGEETVGDRPLKNLLAEVNRKNAALESKLDQFIMAFAQQAAQAQPQTPAPTPQQQYTDEQLEQFAAAGHGWAMGQLAERKAAATADRRFAEHTRRQQAAQELAVLASRNPWVGDPTHPLFQAAMAHKARLHAQGHPDSDETRLSAVRAAIAERPDLAAPPSTGGSSTPMPRSATQVSQQIDASGRRPTPSKSSIKLTERQLELAKRYGVKDPEKAIRDFQKRQEKGTSRLGSVAAFVREEF